jgi:amino acid transporter
MSSKCILQELSSRPSTGCGKLHALGWSYQVSSLQARDDVDLRLLVGLYNPALSLVSMMVMPMEIIYQHPSNMLAVMAGILGGPAFRIMMTVDAFIILCGGVLTALVGVSGLMCRLAGDSILPQVLSVSNSRGAPWVSIFMFVGLSMSLFLVVYDPDNPTGIIEFGGVFVIAFLSVLVAFAVATIILKLHRPHIARRVIARWWEIFLSVAAVLAGWIGNIILTPQVFAVFLCYLSGYVAVVIYMFCRVELLSFTIWMVSQIWQSRHIRSQNRLP